METKMNKNMMMIESGNKKYQLVPVKKETSWMGKKYTITVYEWRLEPINTLKIFKP